MSTPTPSVVYAPRTVLGKMWRAAGSSCGLRFGVGVCAVLGSVTLIPAALDLGSTRLAARRGRPLLDRSVFAVSSALPVNDTAQKLLELFSREDWASVHQLVSKQKSKGSKDSVPFLVLESFKSGRNRQSLEPKFFMSAWMQLRQKIGLGDNHLASRIAVVKSLINYHPDPNRLKDATSALKHCNADLVPEYAAEILAVTCLVAGGRRVDWPMDGFCSLSAPCLIDDGNRPAALIHLTKALVAGGAPPSDAIEYGLRLAFRGPSSSGRYPLTAFNFPGCVVLSGQAVTPEAKETFFKIRNALEVAVGRKEWRAELDSMCKRVFPEVYQTALPLETKKAWVAPAPDPIESPVSSIRDEVNRLCLPPERDLDFDASYSLISQFVALYESCHKDAEEFGRRVDESLRHLQHDPGRGGMGGSARELTSYGVFQMRSVMLEGFLKELKPCYAHTETRKQCIELLHPKIEKLLDAVVAERRKHLVSDGGRIYR